MDTSFQADAERQCRKSLRLDTFALLTTSENEMFKRKSKWECSEVGTDQRERSFPGAPDDSDPDIWNPYTLYVLAHTRTYRVHTEYDHAL